MTSTAESTNDSAQPATEPATSSAVQSAIDDIAGRIADQSPLWPIAHAAGLQNLRAIWEDSAIKRRMDRAVQAKHLGVEEVLQGNQEMPGDISVKRDEIHHHYPAEQSAATPSTIGQAGRKLWPVVLAAALSGGAGAAAPIAYWWLNKPQPTSPVALPDYQLKLEVKDQP